MVTFREPSMAVRPHSRPIKVRDLGWSGGGTHSNVRFYPSAAAAQTGGFRGCKRCRPDATPGSPEWNGRADLADGVVDREGVKGLARRLRYIERHLHGMLVAEVGAGPIALARARRAHTARLLIETTSLPINQMPMIKQRATRKEVVA